MYEHYLASLLLFVFSDGLAKLLKLIVEYVGVRHACHGVEKFRGMEVNNDGGVGVVFLHLWGMRLRAVGFYLPHHLLLQPLCIHHERACLGIVLDECEHIGWLLEEVVLLEGVELVEFHWIETKLYVDDRFQQEALAALVGENLHRYAVEVVKVFATELLYVEFGVWLYLARRSQLPVVSLRSEIGELHIVVAVVNDVCLEAC